ncbi:acyltransferase [Dietzia sp. PP-33]|jgi:peptidoglycan/LPS O-acetylase OafA/YrhL|uniref:acyltransferase family protein n=1 Tax=Dietzia sp. PP-33 TaxID=2957500 RepID=UPI0029ADDFC0|nr:acyltransferase [Dietzia sp. PP-33]MDX2356337.1 acyltransferase [Dietzia sp. PP-33]
MKNASATPDHRVGTLPSATGFVPALEGFRAVAAFAVLTTHVAFQTGSTTGSVVNRIWGRFDLSVTVFFALSGFLLWRAHALHARRGGPGTARSARVYLRSRLVRIMPAYLVLVAAVFLLLPQNARSSASTWTANLTLTQVFVPDSLVEGLTHAWSLSVEMAFYLVLPLLWWALAALRGRAARWRVPVIAAVGVLSLAWALVPWYELGLPERINDQILPPAFASWFAAGMILAELSAAPPGRLAALASRRHARWGWWAVVAVAFGVSTVPRWFTEGFVHPSGPEFAVRTALGAVVAFCLLAPVTLAPHGQRFPILGSAFVGTLGRWSYGVFLWHVLVLHFAFQIAFVPMFSGHMLEVWLVTAVISTVIAAASYSLVEEPSRRWLSPRRGPRGVPRPAPGSAPRGVPATDGQAAANPAQTSPATVAT